MVTDFKKLESTKHMLEWFSEKPFEEITTTVVQMYKKQIPSTKMLGFKVASKPQWLTGTKKDTTGNTDIIVRTGVAFEAEFTLQSDLGTYNLKGVFSWVAVNLDQEKNKTNMWMDLDGTLAQFGSEGELKLRIYKLDN